jgi:hypothetical protein
LTGAGRLTITRAGGDSPARLLFVDGGAGPLAHNLDTGQWIEVRSGGDSTPLPEAF